MKHDELHPLWLRIWHWVNTALICLLILTGVRLRVPGIAFLFAYRNAVLLHRLTGAVMTLSYLFWLVYSIWSGSLRKNYAFHRRDLKNIFCQAEYYAFGVFRGRVNPCPATPEEKFNALQKIAYLSVQFALTPVIAVTGIFFSNIPYFHGAINATGGIRILDAIHVIVAYLFAIYLIVHVYMSTLGAKPLTHIKAMFTGYEEE
jgi:thiosulfate reductase cytochrome b subunit